MRGEGGVWARSAPSRAAVSPRSFSGAYESWRSRRPRTSEGQPRSWNIYQRACRGFKNSFDYLRTTIQISIDTSTPSQVERESPRWQVPSKARAPQSFKSHFRTFFIRKSNRTPASATPCSHPPLYPPSRVDLLSLFGQLFFLDLKPKLIK